MVGKSLVTEHTLVYGIILKLLDNFCNTMIDMYQNGGLIPRGPSGGNYTYVMIGDPACFFFVFGL